MEQGDYQNIALMLACESNQDVLYVGLPCILHYHMFYITEKVIRKQYSDNICPWDERLGYLNSGFIASLIMALRQVNLGMMLVASNALPPIPL